ncbi:murein biosynthesis integral membrane protein MurJ [Planomicrobium sp. CPCC 101079]|uniref:murein biosynthesis integral membrane protein MurJ n=1 Tax=Planomicrobium sp. CPCC 101079 TaxID=2599618 RepID=UPI001647874A|nr:lipid II flippase MurJ [Planomicrobium sp. CPCC 101079]
MKFSILKVKILIKAFSAIFSGSMLGKLLGFVREIILAKFYGTEAPVGAYRTAQTATLIPINFFTSDTLNAGFIPLYVRYNNENKENAKIFLWLIIIGLLLLSFFITLSLFWLSDLWVKLLAPGFSSNIFVLTTDFVKIMAIGIPFYIIGTLLSYVELANKSYILTSIRSSIQSLGLIGGTLLAFYLETPFYLAWGFTVSYIFFFALGVILIYPRGYLAFPSFSKSNLITAKNQLVTFWQVIKPLLLLPFLLQANIAIERMVSSFMGIEVVAAQEYARFISDTGVLLISVPIGLIGLSELSNRTKKEVGEILSNIFILVGIITLPVSCFIFLYSTTIIEILYGRGSFDRDSIEITSQILKGLAIGFWAQILAYIFIKAMSAQLQNKKITIYMAISLGMGSLFNIIFYKILGPQTLGISSSIYGILLFLLTIRDTGVNKIMKKRFYSIFIISFVYIMIVVVTSEYIKENIISSLLIFIIVWGFYLLISYSWIFKIKDDLKSLLK